MESKVARADRLALAFAAALTVSAAFPVRASLPDEGDGETRQAVARLSHIEGQVSFRRGDDETWGAAALNAPFTWGDSLFAATGGRAELQIAGGNAVWLGPGTELKALDFTREVKQFRVGAGTVAVRLRARDAGEVFELATPNGSVTLLKPGSYRVSVDEEGYARVAVRDGEAEIEFGGRSMRVHDGNESRLTGLDAPTFDVYALRPADDFDRWCDERGRLYAESPSYRYVSPALEGGEVLDTYGDWRRNPTYGWVWVPTATAFGWAPYRFGHWCWIDPWGWTWISSEPWGWAPYHYGRWVFFDGLWCWVPVGRHVTRVFYAPALVLFLNGVPGPGLPFSYVAWCPLGPNVPLVPYWRPAYVRSLHLSPVETLDWIDSNGLTIVKPVVLVEARPVQTAIVRDPGIVETVRKWSVETGPPALVPTKASLRVSPAISARVPEPPAEVLERRVVTRLTPPPARASWEKKLPVIRSSGGAPITARAEAELLAGSADEASPAAPVRLGTPASAVKKKEAVPKSPPATESGVPGAAWPQEPAAASPAVLYPKGGAGPAVEKAPVETLAPKGASQEDARAQRIIRYRKAAVREGTGQADAPAVEKQAGGIQPDDRLKEAPPTPGVERMEKTVTPTPGSMETGPAPHQKQGGPGPYYWQKVDGGGGAAQQKTGPSPATTPEDPSKDHRW